MSKGNSQGKKKWCREHRMERYLYYLDQLIEGKVTPEQVTIRSKKLKEVMK